MKAIINSRVYNTETAEFLGEYCNQYGCGDLHYLHEKLYKTTKGAYFLWGSGGAYTQYAIPCGDSWSPGSSIRPLMDDEALEWAAKYIDPEIVEKHFAEMLSEA